MKYLTKIYSSVFKINFDSTKFFGNLFIIFSLLPWVNFGLNNMDSQPWSFIFGIFFLLSLKKITFPDYSINILVFVFLGLVFTLLRTNSLDIFFSLRAIVNYFSLSLFYILFYNYFIRYHFPFKIFIFFNFLWIGFGFLEILSPELMKSISIMRTDHTRGVTSLAPEPTFFAIFLFIISWIFAESKNFIINKKIAIILLINFISVIFLAESAMVTLFYVIVICVILISNFLHVLISLKINKKNMISYVIWISLIYLTLIFAKDLLNETRLIYLVNKFLNAQSILEIIINDASINARVESVYFSVIGSFKNYLIPGGLDSFIEMRREILSLMEKEIFYNRVESNKIMSWAGSLLYELGIFGLLIMVFFFKSIYKGTLRSLFNCMTLFLILFSAIPVAFPLITILMSLMLYNKKFKFKIKKIS